MFNPNHPKAGIPVRQGQMISSQYSAGGRRVADARTAKFLMPVVVTMTAEQMKALAYKAR